MSAARVAIVGGGIAGLSAAYRLLRDDPEVRVTLLEASPRLGGVIQTERRDGYVLEEGPDVILGAKPGGWELAQALGIAGRFHGTRKGIGGSFLLTRGRLARLPEGLTGLVPTKMMPFVKTTLISPLGKLRVAMDFVIPPRRDDADESVERFVVRRLGREMYDRIVEPLLSGIFAGDGSKLSVKATFPHMRAAEQQYGSMGRSMLAAKKRERANARAAKAGAAAAPTAPGGRRPDQLGFLSFPGGLHEMIEALERALRAAGPDRVKILRGARVAGVTRTEDGFSLGLALGGELTADAVILATPAYATADALRGLVPAAADALSEIPYIATATINIAFRRDDVPHRLDGSGWTTPRIEKRPVLACTWSSVKFEGRAPGNVALFRAFVGDATNQSLVGQGDDAIVATVREELRQVLGVTAEPLLVQVNRYPRAMPQYNLGHLERVARIEALVAGQPGLALAGSAYRGVGIPDVIRSGESAATAVMQYLATRRSPVVA